MSNVLMICGSLRKGSFNRALMNALPALAPADMKLTEAPSFRGFPLYDADLQANGFPPDVTALADAIRAADGVIMITPEYNYSIPGALKNAIDWLSRLPDQPFKEKPVAIQSATGGPLGGARMQYHLRHAMIFLNAFSFGTPEIFVGQAATKFDENRLRIFITLGGRTRRTWRVEQPSDEQKHPSCSRGIEPPGSVPRW